MPVGRWAAEPLRSVEAGCAVRLEPPIDQRLGSVGEGEQGWAVGRHDHGSAVHQPFQRIHERPFGSQVESGGRLIEQDNG
jgi:hypothetical protein